MSKIRTKTLDFYLNYPLSFDSGFVLLFFLVPTYYPFISIFLSDKGIILNVFSTLIGTCISLAGFLLAALTIIVTFRSNIKTRGYDDSVNALEFILSSGYYKKIVSVYSKSIVEFITVAILLYLCWIFIDNLKPTSVLTKIAVSGVFCITTTISRSLWVLFKILQSEHVTRR